MKWMIYLLVIFGTTLSANPYIERTVESINYRTYQGGTIGLITLSDGSTWKWSPDLFSENLLRKWEMGDKVIISALNQPGFVLDNPSKPHYSPQVALSFHSYHLFPAIEKYSHNSGIVILSDGTAWELEYDFNKRTLHHWAYGDRIIPVQGAFRNHTLINIDIPYNNPGQVERTVQVSPVDLSAILPPQEHEKNPEEPEAEA